MRTVLFLESTAQDGTSPLEGINMTLAGVFLELSDVKNIKILPNGENSGLKSITSAAMISNKWSKFNKYVMCYNEVVDLT